MLEIQLSPEASEELRQLAEALNEKLREAGSSSAERAFGIGCGAGLLPALALVLVLLLLQVINVIIAFTLLVLALLGLLGAGMLAASIARTNVIRRIYQEEVEPEIARFGAHHKLPRTTFDALAFPLLPEGAPLREFLAPPLILSSEPES